MAEAFICDLSGKLCPGKAQVQFLAPVKGEVELLVYPQRRIDEMRMAPGQLAPEVVARILKALAEINWEAES